MDSKNLAVAGLLVLAGVVGRFAFLHVPNFQPTAAVALFAGFYFASRRQAVLIPVAVLALSNLWLSGYETWGVMAVVYAAFIVPVGLGRLLANREREQGAGTGTGSGSGSGAGAGRYFAKWAVCLIAPSLVFFATTNFAVWLFDGRYLYTLAGLTECYVSAIPFYGYTLAGDLIFVPVLFGAWFACRAGMQSLRTLDVARYPLDPA
ncbi:MAG: DUF6580 family putative transport protein [Pirellulales bacterium]